jgi:ribosomal RNA-processing protein 36
VKLIYFLFSCSKQQQIKATMEAASSGSDDSSSDGSESRPQIARKADHGRSKKSLEDDEGATREDERENNDSDDSSSEEDSVAGSEADSGRDPEEESESEIDDSADEEDESAPLAERVQRQREQGVSLQAPRQRKNRAKKIASERLAQFRKEKKTAEDDDDNSVEKGVEAGEKKKSKHAPTESSSKRADFYRRTPTLNGSGIGVDIGAHKYKPRDPRVDNLSGHLDVQHFEHNFDFLQDMRAKEMGTLRKNIAARKAGGRNGQSRRRRMGLTNDGGSLEEDQLELKRLTQEKADVERARIDRAAKQTVKKKLHEDVAEGKRGVFFPKRKEMKRLHLEAKYEEIRKRGGDRAVDKVVAKRRKKNKSKDAGLLGKGIPKNYGTAAAGTSYE